MLLIFYWLSIYQAANLFLSSVTIYCLFPWGVVMWGYFASFYLMGRFYLGSFALGFSRNFKSSILFCTGTLFHSFVHSEVLLWKWIPVLGSFLYVIQEVGHLLISLLGDSGARIPPKCNSFVSGLRVIFLFAFLSYKKSVLRSCETRDYTWFYFFSQNGKKGIREW